MTDRKRPEQRLVGDREDRGVRADAERQGDQGDDREQGRAAEIAKGVAEVLKHPWLYGNPLALAGGLNHYRRRERVSVLHSECRIRRPRRLRFRRKAAACPMPGRCNGEESPRARGGRITPSRITA